jgi:hypothetical protein
MNYLVFHFTDQVTLSKILVYQALDRLKKNQMEWPLQKILLLIGPVDSSAQFTISLNKSTIAPVGWLPLQAYPDTYFSVAMISLTEGFSGGLLERIREISPLRKESSNKTFNGC